MVEAKTGEIRPDPVDPRYGGCRLHGRVRGRSPDRSV